MNIRKILFLKWLILMKLKLFFVLLLKMTMLIGSKQFEKFKMNLKNNNTKKKMKTKLNMLKNIKKYDFCLIFYFYVPILV